MACVLGLNLLLILGFVFLQSGTSRTEKLYGEVIHETTSEFSLIRVREKGGIRSLFFVDERGREQRQSAIDVLNPHQLQLRYSRSIFSTFLFRNPQEHVLIVGLGGGGMVRFLNHVMPETKVDAVEIDPAVVSIAADYFGTHESDTNRIFTQDAFVFLREATNGPYDVIYMDAFLKPTVNPGASEVTQRLKTVTFLKDVQARLKPGGLLAFNLIESHNSTAKDLSAIRETFPSVYLFSVPGSGNLVVIASLEETPVTEAELAERIGKIEPRLRGQLPFEQFVESLRP